MNCTACRNPIEPERLEALPDTDRCITCATSQDARRPRPQGFMIATAAKGTAMTLVRIDPENKEAMRQAKRAHFRSR